MKHHKLRITWSVTWGVVGVLLIAMWGRSYFRFDSIGRSTTTGNYKSYFSLHGHITYLVGFNPNNVTSRVYTEIGHQALQPFVDSPGEPPMSNFLGVRHYSSHGRTAFRELIIAIPYWHALLFVGAIGAVPWLGQVPYRFSLRTLLIVTTILAVILGVGMMMLR